MIKKYRKKRQKGIISIVLAIILAGISLVTLVGLAVFVVWLNQFIAGLVGGGNQPGGNCNVGCGFDESKISLYTNGGAEGISDATSEEAKNFAVGKLNVDASQIVSFDKSQVENMIRAEISKQWSALSTEQQHGATQTDAQHAILSYQYHEDSSFQMFVNSGGRLVPKHDSTTIQLLSISKDKFEGNKRQEIALNWDIKYTIYTGVKENFGAFLNKASGSGAERWKQAIAYVFLPANPNCYWTNPGSPCRSGAAQEGWNKYQNETAYNCQIGGCALSFGSNNVPLFKQCDPRWREKSYGCGGTTICSAGCGTTSAAMVLKFYGKDVDPAVMAQESLNNGYRICDQGTSSSFFSFIAGKYGLKYQAVDFDPALAALKQNKPIIVAVKDSLFSSGGHYIVLTGINSEGMVMINDSGPRNVTKATQNDVRAAWSHGHLITP